MAIYKGNIPNKNITFHAMRDSIDPDLPKLLGLGMNTGFVAIDVVGFFTFVAKSPEQYAGKRVLVFHGTDNYTVPQATQFALDKYGDSIDMIFCCYPKRMRRNLGDDRIQWSTIDKPLYVMSVEIEGDGEEDDSILFTVKEK